MLKSFIAKTAFLSCANKTGIPELAKALHDRGWVLHSAGKTHTVIADEGVPVIDIKTLPDSVGEMLDHRLLTLQPCVHGGLLTNGSQAHSLELVEAGYPEIFELVIIDLYPFSSAVKELQSGKGDIKKVWEMIDVGGPSMLKSAIKGLKFPVVTKSRRDGLIEWIDGGYEQFESNHNMALREAMTLVSDRELEHLQFLNHYLFMAMSAHS